MKQNIKKGTKVDDFNELIEIIEVARTRAFQAASRELIVLYWNIGEYISKKVAINHGVNPLLMNLLVLSKKNIWESGVFLRKIFGV